MQNTDLLNRYGGVATYLGFDLVAILLMTYVLYFRRHWRADLLLSYVALNIGIFVTMSLLTQVRVDIAVGFGLFAILSIIRLRSSAVTQQEVAYYFVALVLGLVNGMGVPDRGLVVGMNLVLLLTMFAVDSRLLRDRARRMDVRLDGVFTNEAALVAELERKLGGRVAYQEQRGRPDPWSHAHRRAAAAGGGRHRAAGGEVAPSSGGRSRAGARSGRPWRGGGGVQLRRPLRRPDPQSRVTRRVEEHVGWCCGRPSPFSNALHVRALNLRRSAVRDPEFP